MSGRVWRIVAVSIAAALGLFTTEQPADMTLFATAGRSVLTGHLSALYGVSGDQAGPVQVVLARLLTIGGDPADPSRWTRAGVNALLMLAALWVAGRTGPGRPGHVTGRELGVAAYVALWLATPAFWGGHPIEMLVPVAWIAAARLDRAHPGRAALLLVLATAIAPWAVLGYPCLLRRGRLASGVRTAALAGVMSTLIYIPFLFAGRGRALGHRWVVSQHSLVHAVLPNLGTVDWNLRLVQAVVVAAGCAGVALARPETRLTAPVAAMAAALLRLLTDPMTFDYYWIPVGTAAVAVVLFAPDYRTRTGALALATAYLAWACSPLGWGPAGGLGLLALVGLFLPLWAPARPVTRTAGRIYGAGIPQAKGHAP